MPKGAACGPHCEYEKDGLGPGRDFEWHCNCSQCHGR